LFYASNQSRRYDVVVVGFSEYVTAKEYSSYERFVATGGKLILVDACNFVAEVNYNSSANTISLVQGHGWNFNGSAAWNGSFNRWTVNNTNWIGSNYGHYYTEGYHVQSAQANTTNPESQLLQKIFGQKLFAGAYKGHEENYISNSTDSIISYWILSNFRSRDLITAYSHVYIKGVVVHTGIFGTDILGTNSQMQFFVLTAILTGFGV
jgi:hypothetical protein